MHPQFYLGLSLAFLFIPLGVTIGINLNARDELKKFRENKGAILRNVIL